MALRFRQAARALLLDPDDHVLLVRFEFPTATVWGLPGGGLDEGESVADALRRELHEELGLSGFELGPHVWNREHVIPMMTGHDGQQDRIHLVRLDRFEPEPTIGWEAMRAEHVHEVRWWSLDELAGVPTDVEVSPGQVRCSPRRLASLVRDLLDSGPPSAPIDTGI
ncbi:MAG: NUDIX domain-containing protein [Ilumatobacteraceae bacterium]|nr:NUDIX domain-containing protein [Ilumatobacteraceae bacterium]